MFLQQASYTPSFGGLGLRLGDPVVTSPAIDDGVLYVPDVTGGSEAKLIAIDIYTGQESWTVTLPGSAGLSAISGGGLFASGVAVSDGVVFVVTNIASSYQDSVLDVHAVDIEERRPLWQADMGNAGGQPFQGQANRGSPFASFGVFGLPSVAEDIVYIGNGMRNLHALFAKTGDLLWEVPTGGIVNSTPFVADGAVYFTSVDGYLYAVE